MSINTTPNLHLPQWMSDEKPSFLVDMNGAYSRIDTAYGEMSAAQKDLETRQTTVEQKAETASENAQTAIQTANSASEAATHAQGDAQLAQADATAAQNTANQALSTSSDAENTANTIKKLLTPVDVKDKITVTDAKFTTIAINYAVLSGNVLNISILFSLTATSDFPEINATITGLTNVARQQLSTSRVSTNLNLNLPVIEGNKITDSARTLQMPASGIAVYGAFIISDTDRDNLRNQT